LPRLLETCFSTDYATIILSSYYGMLIRINGNIPRRIQKQSGTSAYKLISSSSQLTHLCVKHAKIVLRGRVHNVADDVHRIYAQAETI
jgi:hypothetical protein